MENFALFCLAVGILLSIMWLFVGTLRFVFGSGMSKEEQAEDYSLTITFLWAIFMFVLGGWLYLP